MKASRRSLRAVFACVALLPFLAAYAEDAPEVAPPEPPDYWTGPISGPVPATITGGTVLRTEQLAALMKRGDALLVDVSNLPERPAELPASSPWMPAPHAVIPGSVWIPGAGLGVISPDVEALFRKYLSDATAEDATRPIVIYCHERCWLSWNAAKRAIRFGHRNVYWYPEGIEGWRAAGYGTTTAEPVRPLKLLKPPSAAG